MATTTYAVHYARWTEPSGWTGNPILANIKVALWPIDFNGGKRVDPKFSSKLFSVTKTGSTTERRCRVFLLRNQSGDGDGESSKTITQEEYLVAVDVNGIAFRLEDGDRVRQMTGKERLAFQRELDKALAKIAVEKSRLVRRMRKIERELKAAEDQLRNQQRLENFITGGLPDTEPDRRERQMALNYRRFARD